MLPPFTAHRHAELDSTNQEAMRQARAGAASGVVVIADVQSAGRGRHGRRWQSIRGNLLLSLMLRPGVAVDKLPQVSFVAGLAAADAADAFLHCGPVGLKWPNDILLDDAKLCGILIESELAGADVEWMVVGVGMNIVAAPENLDYKATSLAAHGSDATRDQVADAFLSAFRRRWQGWREEGFEKVRAAWMSRAWRAGNLVSVSTGAELLSGCFAGIDEAGAMLLGTDAGTRRILSGSVSYAPLSAGAA